MLGCRIDFTATWTTATARTTIRIKQQRDCNGTVNGTVNNSKQQHLAHLCQHRTLSRHNVQHTSKVHTPYDAIHHITVTDVPAGTRGRHW